MAEIKPAQKKNKSKLKKTVKKIIKNIYIIVKALSILAARAVNKVKAFSYFIFEKIKAYKIGTKLKKALMYLIRFFVIVYCICVEGTLWLVRLLGPKLRKIKLLRNTSINFKSLIPKTNKKINFSYINNFFKSALVKIKTILKVKPAQKAAKLESGENNQRNEIVAAKPSISKKGGFLIKEAQRNCENYLVLFRRKTKDFFKNPRYNFKELSRSVVKFNKQHNNILTPISVVSLCFILGLYVVSNYTLGLNVYNGSDIIASTSSQAKFESYLSDFENKISQELCEKYDSDLDLFYELSLVSKSKVDNYDELERYLMLNDHEIAEMYVIKGNDKVIAANLNEDNLKKALENYKNRYSSGVEGEKIEFCDDVVIEKQLSKVELYKSTPEIEELLVTSSGKEIDDHVVQQGETISGIASSYTMRTSELLALNPEVEEKRLQIGSRLSVSREKPLISVKTIKPIDYSQALAYGTKTELDDSMYKNQTKVKSAGVLGEEVIKAEVVLIDGVEVDRVVLERQTKKEPVDQVLLKGTKALPSTAATGSMRTPVSGVISSRFGYRGKEFHTGLDIAAPTGTPVYAADGGKVIFAGWNGSYGYIIKLDHQNGFQTWYAHLSAINVSVGTSVAKGSRIGSVGSTGRSTGAHLHLEVRKNGVAVNPQSYLK